MSTISGHSQATINLNNNLFSSIRVIIETAFYGNNVQLIDHLAQAYQLATKSPGTIVTDLAVSHTEELKLPKDSKVLVFNDGEIIGRTAAARRVIGEPGISQVKYEKILREAIYQSRIRQFYHGKVIVGLDQEFSVKAHVLVPEGFENNLYSYLLNFEVLTAESETDYQHSQTYNEGDLYIFADPEWQHPAFPDGLVLIDAMHNVAAVLGLRYFGELKKATLTLAWALANRNGFIACHGGLKQYQFPTHRYTMAVFGLSGSGKSTITLARSADDVVTVLHDDAFVISKKKGSTTALEPAYFDKTQDYASNDPTVSSFLTCQNVGVTLNDSGEKVLVTEDIRNGNGRAIKSRFVTPNRVDHLDDKIDAVFWIMKDDVFPPVVKINDPILAAIFGATLATKRSSAENIRKEEVDQLVYVPYANPFRVYPLAEDYQAFKELFEKQDTDCYILNTGYFDQKKITPEVTLKSVEAIAKKQAQFLPLGKLSELSYLPVTGFPEPFNEATYQECLYQRLTSRYQFILEQEELLSGYHELPAEAIKSLKGLLKKLKK
ncbi:phosphoenolpyruvate carboxykinase (ATP) [Enterococcus sp. DIV0660C]|uniref:phosphoenolpyruvate carboxykinase (ATP) n=1 Tax=Enterococcus sp. DIV0660C TaxID=2230880 RepID=UPI001A8D443E|nr:phosphoenolpyruvate carboxykinase (ATP) [Enterococcus sp. DIV0660C]MBO0432513.1 phosphoenolpyruvate carboxykinase (ATP) [Enterococcus sp. DIV0660C]